MQVLIGFFSGITLGGIIWSLDNNWDIKGLLAALVGAIFIAITVIIALANRKKNNEKIV